MENNLKELQEILHFGKVLKDGIADSLADKKIRWPDLFNFAKLPKTIGPAFDNLGDPIARWRALTREEKIQIRIEVYKEVGSLTPDEIDALVEETLVTLTQLVELAKAWGKLKKAA